MHLVKAYVMPYHTVTLQKFILKILQTYINLSAQNFESFNYTAGKSLRLRPWELPQPHAGISLYSPPLIKVQTQSLCREYLGSNSL